MSVNQASDPDGFADGTTPWRLTAEDAAALDALAEAGLDVRQIPPGTLSDRQLRAARVLAQLFGQGPSQHQSQGRSEVTGGGGVGQIASGRKADQQALDQQTLEMLAERESRIAAVMARVTAGVGGVAAGPDAALLTPEHSSGAKTTSSEIWSTRMTSADQAKLDGWIGEDSGLSPDDEDALEALVAAGFEPRSVTGALRPRAEHILRLLSGLGAPIATVASADVGFRVSGVSASEGGVVWADREARVAATLAAIERVEDHAALRRRLGGPGRREESAAELGGGLGRFAFRIREVAAVAAVLAIGAAILAPMTSHWRDQSSRTACVGNMAGAGVAFAQYAGDFRDSYPMASASVVGTPWWLTGRSAEHSNSANLFTLVRAGYSPLRSLACQHSPFWSTECGEQPRPDQFDWSGPNELTLSFRVLFTADRPRWGQGGPRGERQVVLADRSPITLDPVELEREPRIQDPMANSQNHGGRGQSVLFGDGSSVFTTTPVVNGDNLWLPRGFEQAIDLSRRLGRPVILRLDASSEAGDAFVGP